MTNREISWVWGSTVWSLAPCLAKSFTWAGQPVTDRVWAQMGETCFLPVSLSKPISSKQLCNLQFVFQGMCNLSAHLVNFQKPKNQFATHRGTQTCRDGLSHWGGFSPRPMIILAPCCAMCSVWPPARRACPFVNRGKKVLSFEYATTYMFHMKYLQYCVSWTVWTSSR